MSRVHDSFMHIILEEKSSAFITVYQNAFEMT